jgi:uncharacterized membrane protein AbrB (regulator of aidB expression)
MDILLALWVIFHAIVCVTLICTIIVIAWLAWRVRQL